MKREADVVIIGGGPAGLAAGIVLAEAGVETLLCEKQAFPIDKPCGEGVMPTGWEQLCQLGVAAFLAEKDSRPLAGIRYFSPSGIRATGHFAEGPGRGIHRTVLSLALWEKAKSLPCLQLVEGTAAQPLAQTERGVEVQVEGQKIKARLLIGADGLRSGVRRWAGLEGKERRWQRWGARQHFHITPWSDFVEVSWSRQGVEAYVTPVGNDRVNVAFLWHRDRVQGLAGGDNLFPSLLHHFPALQARLAGARRVDSMAATGPLQQPVRRAVSEGTLLLGDAAGYLDAITGEGISLALAGALALKETVVPALKNGSGRLPEQALALYQQQHQQFSRSYYQITGLLLWLSRFPALADFWIAALERQPVLFQNLLSANMGLAFPWTPANGLRLLLGLIPRPSRQPDR